MPKVSFIVPCFDQWGYLSGALASIRAQTVTDHETILVCETTKNWPTTEYWEPPMVDKIVWHRENIGLAEARTSALRLSESQWVVPLDADDTIEPTFLERTLAAGRCSAVAVNSETPLGPGILENNYLPYCALFDRKFLLELGGWQQPTKTQGIEDWYLWVRLYDAGAHVITIPDKLFHWNRHPGSLSSQFEGKPIFEEMKREMLARRNK